MTNGNQAQSAENNKSKSSLDKQPERHKELSITIRRTMFAMLAYSASCGVIIAQPDVPFVLTSSGVQIPVIDVAVNLKAFLLVGPLGLIAITAYLHLFLTELNRITGLNELDKQPFLFNFQNRFSQVSSFLTFYATPLFVMVAFSWKSAVIEWRWLMYFATMIVTVGMFLLYYKPKLREPQFITVILLTFGMVVLFGQMAFLSMQLGKHLTRGLNLKNAQLAEVKFREIDLTRANLRYTNLRKADLKNNTMTSANLFEANLDGANLQGANLYRANLRGAYLRNSNLILADLSTADLSEADLGTADLSASNLTAAKLERADLTGAILDDAMLSGVDLSSANLHAANLNGANLEAAKNLTVYQLCKAWSLYGTEIDTDLRNQVRNQCPDLLDKPKQ